MTLACRWCQGELEDNPVFSLLGVPKGAQALPTENELLQDQSVDLYLHRCTDCALVQTVGEPVAYYRDVIRANAFSPAMQTFRQEQLSEWVRSHRLEGAKVLEVGCGRGEFLELLRRAGAAPVGTEHGKESAAQASNAGFNVHNMFLGDSPLPDKEIFAAWVSFNFLEHWPHPRLVLRHLRASLAPRSVGLVEVPNFEMMLKERLLTEFIPDHIFYFTADTLRRCLETAGFEVISVKPIWHDYILSAQVQLRPPMAITEFVGALDHLSHQLHNFVNQHAEHGVAIWGAGHQALTTLALCSLGSKIRYVVDSAPFKQGKYTPVTHLPIHDPYVLSQHKVGAVVVMAAGYSDEVVSILRRHYDPAMAVAVVVHGRLELR
jgi:SAM-dependent methyltransferase